jgi:hypothetical protein
MAAILVVYSPAISHRPSLGIAVVVMVFWLGVARVARLM